MFVMIRINPLNQHHEDTRLKWYRPNYGDSLGIDHQK